MWYWILKTIKTNKHSCDCVGYTECVVQLITNESVILVNNLKRLTNSGIITFTEWFSQNSYLINIGLIYWIEDAKLKIEQVLGLVN